MAQRDLSEKILEEYNDVFADIVNVLLFGGEEIIKPDELYASEARTQYKAEDGMLHEQERDVVKFWKRGGVNIALYGIENQTSVDRYMPLRVIGYDGATYRSQLLRAANRPGTQQNEKAKKCPVITLVLYFGVKRWNGPRRLAEVLEIPERLKPYVNDYKINVFEISYLTDEQISKFKSDFGILADFFVNKRKNKNYIPKDKKKFKHVDAMLKILMVMAKNHRYEMDLSCIERSGDNMDNIFDNVFEMGMNKGVQQIIEKMLRKNYTDEQIIEICGISEKELEEYKKEVFAGV